MPKATAKLIDRLMDAWKKFHGDSAVAEQRKDAARAAVTAVIRESGEKVLNTKHGPIPLQTKTVYDWEGLARSLLAGDIIDKELPKFTRQSAEFISAPRGWSAEAKANS